MRTVSVVLGNRKSIGQLTFWSTSSYSINYRSRPDPDDDVFTRLINDDNFFRLFEKIKYKINVCIKSQNRNFFFLSICAHAIKNIKQIFFFYMDKKVTHVRYVHRIEVDFLLLFLLVISEVRVVM